MEEKKNTVVTIAPGKIEGSFEKGLYRFRGIPFAAPPVGELRWLPPAPVKPWRDIKQSVQYASIACQPLLPAPPGMPAEEPEAQSEDCLYLNVTTPGLDGKRRPVMVWIHGGGFSVGSGSQPQYRSGRLVRRGDLVMVTVNYRLGVLGFLNLKEVSGGRIPSTGNEGLLDQIAALEWVKNNIAAFGGDPDNVTVFGESAGAMSIGCLLNMPGARGLFKRAILESPVGDMARPKDFSVYVITGELLRILGIEDADGKALRALTPEKLMAAQLELATRTGQGLAPCIPVADGEVLPMLPLESFAAGRAIKVPVIVGSNLEEQKLFAQGDPGFKTLDDQGLLQRMTGAVGSENARVLIDTYRSRRQARGEPVNARELYCAIMSDYMFRNVALSIAEGQCNNGVPAFNYCFTWKSPALGGELGACHALELGFVFGNYTADFCGSGPEVDRLAQLMQDAWISFARSGSPSVPGLDWPAYCRNQQSMVFGGESYIGQPPNETERRVWSALKNIKLGKMP